MSAFNMLVATLAAAPSLSPPSFENRDWLYLVNLFEFPTVAQICGAFCIKLTWDMIVCLRAPIDSPHHDEWRSPIQVLRRIGILITLGFALRGFSEAQSLWRWYSFDVAGSGRAMALKRFLDPIAANIGILGVAVLYLSLPGLTEQLRKRPYPISMWTSLPMLKRPACAVSCFLAAALALVVFR